MTLKLEDFCDAGEKRAICQRPYQIDNKTFATNGATALFLPKHGEYLPCPDNFSEVTRKIIASFDDLQFIPLPDDIKIPEFKACDTCGTTGVHCRECHNEGEVQFRNEHNAYSFQCQTCYGDDSPCRECAGTGNAAIRIVVLGVGVNSDHLKRIMNEPGIEIAIAQPYRKSNVLFFRVGDAQGLIMELKE